MSHYGNYPNIELCRKYGCHFLKTNMCMCVGCLIPEKEKQALIKANYDKAVAYSKEIKSMVVTYESSDGVPNYMEAEAAKLASVRVTGYIPYVSDVING